MKQNAEKNKSSKTVLAFIMSLLLILTCGGASVFAAETDAVPDLPGGPYSLTVNVKSTNPDGTKTGIKGAKLSIYKVALLDVKNTAANYTATQAFSEAGIDFEDMTASESNTAAKTFAKLVNSKGIASAGEKKTNGAGEAVFSDLSPGIYLVMMDGYDGSDARYTDMDPFLVLVPGIDRSGKENAWISNVSVSPKIAISPKDYLEVNPPVEKKVEGNDNAKDTFTFELAAEDITNPMPLGARDGKKQITITGEGDREFGSWKYTEPGTYRYTIREIAGTNKNYKYDKRVYHLTDKVSYSGSKLQLERTITDKDGNTYNDETMTFKFVNKYNKPGVPGIPKTGDDTNLLLWLLIALVSGVTAAAFVIRGKSRQ